MTHIKRLTMKGFKSFPSKTEIIFDKGINTIVGPNGSGKSNISDALCFALGRLSIKSMRAAKAKNLLFMGSKLSKPAKEASVEIVFDNSNKTFNLPQDEISLKRIVRHNGVGIYKINGETKTRGEVIETLAHAGIDPYGFNIILQGQIQSLIKLHPEERRKIIEEVAGISIYESRKEKSLKELEKTADRLKEISTILRERTAFLKNLENERSQALRYKELEKTIQRCKASIITKKIEEKQKEVNGVKNSISSKTSLKEKTKSDADSLQETISSLNSRIEQINKHIQQSSGIEQETLKETISNLKAELEGLKVRKENYENRRAEIENRIEKMQESIPEYEEEIKELRKESPLLAKKQEALTAKKQELSSIEEERKNAYKLKTELMSLKDRLKDKHTQLSRISAESDSLVEQIEELSRELKNQDQEACEKSITKLEKNLEAFRKEFEHTKHDELKHTKLISVAESQHESAVQTKTQVQDLDVCPLCQNKMTSQHIDHVMKDSESKIQEAQKTISKSELEIEKITNQVSKILENLHSTEKNLSDHQRELSSHSLVRHKQDYVKKLVEQEALLKKEVQVLEEKQNSLEKRTFELSAVEDRYTTKMLEIEEISSRTSKDLDTTLLYKERELQRIQEVIKQSTNDLEEIDSETEEISESIERKSGTLEKKEQEDSLLAEKFKKLFSERDSLQEEIQKSSYNHSTIQNELRQIEEQVNYLKVGNAKLSAEKEALEMELGDYPDLELIKASPNALEERLQKAQQSIQTIGSINLRALEVYDDIKKEYDIVYEKAQIIEREKEEVLKIIEEIDKKKKRTFMKTFKGINELFNRNFSQLSEKGQAFLDLENKENIFEGGINIIIKMRKGKHFDVSSLSGGEQTLVALSLLFAIQEHKPHHFYIFDEIDAALDKRNSERLSALLKKYIRSGQYIIITHNDAIITDSSSLYGVSMHEGVSKVLSLKLD